MNTTETELVADLLEVAWGADEFPMESSFRVRHEEEQGALDAALHRGVLCKLPGGQLYVHPDHALQATPGVGRFLDAVREVVAVVRAAFRKRQGSWVVPDLPAQVKNHALDWALQFEVLPNNGYSRSGPTVTSVSPTADVLSFDTDRLTPRTPRLAADAEGNAPVAGDKLMESESTVGSSLGDLLTLIRSEVSLVEVEAKRTREYRLAINKLWRWAERAQEAVRESVSEVEANKLSPATHGVIHTRLDSAFYDSLDRFTAGLDDLIEALSFDGVDTLRERGRLAQKAKLESSTVDGFELLLRLLRNFHHYTRPLLNPRKGRESVVLNDEAAVQDHVEALLRAVFDDVRPEDVVPNAAGATSRVDFALREIGAVVEVKRTRQSLRDKEVGEELVADVERYRNYPDCFRLVAFIYDPDGQLRNPKSLVKDLEAMSSDDQEVVVIVCPA